MLMKNSSYLMESQEEVLRLDVKTDPKRVEEQAQWAGIRPGMRVADLGCGSGKTSFVLNQLIQPNGEVLGVDFSEQRINYANENYRSNNLSFHCRDIREPLDDLGKFDFVWVRFVLEYYRSNSFDIVKLISKLLKPKGIICLIDLDYNSLTNHGLPSELEKAISEIMGLIENRFNFDPYVGRKLYSFLYDLGYSNIEVNLSAHNLIYGPLKEADKFNFRKKIEVAGNKTGYTFDNFGGSPKKFYEEFMKAFSDPRRFLYTPLISCRGQKPLSG